MTVVKPLRPVFSAPLGRRGIAALAMAMGVVMLVGSQTDSQASVAPLSGPLSDPVLELSAQAMADDFDISLDESRTRMLRQAQLVVASEDLQKKLGATWAGSYFDHAADGALVVQTTSTDLAAPAVENTLTSLSQDGVDATSAGAAPLRLRTVDASLNDLQFAVGEAQRSIPAHEGDTFVKAGASVSATIDIVENTVDVIVALPDRAPADLQQAAAIRAEAAADIAESVEPAIAGRVEVEVEDAAMPASCSPVYSICDPALRGGQGIASTQLCSIGLPVRSRTDKQPYILTAGHCFDGIRTRNFDYYSHEPGG